MLRSPPLSLLPLALLALSGCIEESTLPGDEVLATFTLNASLVPGNNCPAGEVPDGGFAFDGTLSRDRDGQRAYFIVSGFARDAGFDGQRLTSVQRASQPGYVQGCGTGCTAVEVEQTLRLLLLSRSQNELYGKGKSCAELLDGGLPLDGGALPPGAGGDGGFDAVRACGDMSNLKLPDAGCSCAQCTWSYSVEGAPRVGN
ncbi:MAG TPA: hypothetical protein VFO83_03475 [Aggregicoccus sp.]|nr:hypothetical protein [Aggregicoccus sp.]